MRKKSREERVDRPDMKVHWKQKKRRVHAFKILAEIQSPDILRLNSLFLTRARRCIVGQEKRKEKKQKSKEATTILHTRPLA